jgi:hypothetical protein
MTTPPSSRPPRRGWGPALAWIQTARVRECRAPSFTQSGSTARARPDPTAFPVKAEFLQVSGLAAES